MAHEKLEAERATSDISLPKKWPSSECQYFWHRVETYWDIAKAMVVVMRVVDKDGAHDSGAIGSHAINCKCCNGISTASWCLVDMLSDEAWHILWHHRAFNRRVTFAEICGEVEAFQNKQGITEVSYVMRYIVGIHQVMRLLVHNVNRPQHEPHL